MAQTTRQAVKGLRGHVVGEHNVSREALSYMPIVRQTVSLCGVIQRVLVQSLCGRHVHGCRGNTHIPERRLDSGTDWPVGSLIHVDGPETIDFACKFTSKRTDATRPRHTSLNAFD